MYLTGKQKRFCDEYLKGLNATQAMIRSGFTNSIHFPGDNFFVYCLIDSRNNQIFYIGKGKGKRPYKHITDYKNGIINNAFKHQRIHEILQSNHTIKVFYLDINLTEHESFQIESAFIKAIGTQNLTNISGGFNKESVKAWADSFLKQIKKLSHFVKENRSPLEVEYYLKVVAEVLKIRKQGYISEIIQDACGLIKTVVKQ